MVHPRLVTIARGGTAHAYLTVADPGNLSPACNPSSVRWVRVYAPGQFRAKYAHRTVLVCTDGTRNMFVRPVRPGHGEG
jgi:hypothetical protein